MPQTSFFVGPNRTPKIIKWLIWITASITLLSPLATYGFEHFFHLLGPNRWLSLSLPGLLKGWLWQPFTYFFLHSTETNISLSLLFTLFFNLLVFWFTGSEFVSRYGSRNFLFFYLGAGICAGWVSSLLLFLFSSQAILVGCTPPLFACVMMWAMLHPELDLFFFFVIRIKAKWLAAVYMGIALLMNLSAGTFISFAADLTGIIWGFCIGRFVFHLPNPYPLNLEFPKQKKRKAPHHDKIIDISVFQEDDDAFMDRMLDKIAKEGKERLTKREQQRMKEVSERKNNHSL